MSGSISSSLSELSDDPVDDQVDTEAETERLEISPQKMNKTPTKATAAPNAEIASEATTPVIRAVDSADNSSLLHSARDDDGLIPDGTPSPTKASPPPELAGKKRKRKSSMSSTNGIEPARKRSSSSRIESSRRADLRKAATSRDPEAIEEINEDEDSVMPVEENHASDMIAVEETGGDNEVPASIDAVDEKKSRSSDGGRSRSVTPGAEPDSRDEEVNAEIDAEGDVEGDAEGYAEGDAASVAGAEVEEDEGDAVAKSEDELARKKAALDALVPIEKNFKILREKLYNEKISELDAELESLTSAVPTHQELLGMLRAIDIRRDEKVQHEQTLLYYKRQALERKIVGTRAQIHSQCFQELRQLKEDFLEELNKESSRRRREMRKTEPCENHFIHRFNPRRADQILQQTSYNKEVSILSGLALYRGFPAAPSIMGASSEEVAGDLRAMMISAKQPVYAQITHPPRDAEVALEQDFVQKTPWANPNHPAAQQAYNRERQASANRELGLPASQSWSIGLSAGPRGQEGRPGEDGIVNSGSPPMSSNHLTVEAGMRNSYAARNERPTIRQHSYENIEEACGNRDYSPVSKAARERMAPSEGMSNRMHADQPLSSQAFPSSSQNESSSHELVKKSEGDQNSGGVHSPEAQQKGKDTEHVAEQGPDVRDRFPFGQEHRFVNGSLPRVGVEQIGGR